jgi:hypothetical protein
MSDIQIISGVSETTPALSPSSKRLLPIVVLEAFNLLPNEPASLKLDKRTVICKGCNMSIVYTAEFGTKNLIKHLNTKHSSHLALIEAYEKAKSTEDKSKTKNVRLSPYQTSIPTESPTVKRNLFKLSDPLRVKVNMEVAKLVVFDSLPLSIVDSSNFRSVFATLDERYVPPTSKTLKNSLIPDLRNDIMSKITSKLKECESVNISIDAWSDPTMRSFLGICFHSITNDMKIIKGLLACERITGSHTGVMILNHFKEVIKQHHLTDKLFKVISDGGSNMVKAFKEPPFSELDKISLNFCTLVHKLKVAKPPLPPISKSTTEKRKAHLLPLEDEDDEVSEDEDYDDDDDDDEDGDEGEDDECFLETKENIVFSQNGKNKFDAQKLYEQICNQICNTNFKIGRMPCVAHMLQLVVTYVRSSYVTIGCKGCI